ncbi:uncharacterized protein PHALS_07147 [Plasmopara halstedii]|uniref:Uncharacterized protein n=1 Tax=Plasmopara halstedii TaxID=4781 RepID=A0A0P1B6L1_PLAHL|nr:uncharacterized protein PHALS_07147 [Plasmopara halstedii]CEG49382.1 hypothetical protein PHALS_07147 [Plasmopara halstedii]|eukprot:XP_024585751.1 hypothetical protein PHALS_07147 [Plasmopara halstedii]
MCDSFFLHPISDKSTLTVAVAQPSLHPVFVSKQFYKAFYTGSRRLAERDLGATSI